MKDSTYPITTILTFSNFNILKTKISKDCGIKLQWIKAISPFKLFLFNIKKERHVW